MHKCTHYSKEPPDPKLRPTDPHLHHELCQDAHPQIWSPDTIPSEPLDLARLIAGIYRWVYNLSQLLHTQADAVT